MPNNGRRQQPFKPPASRFSCQPHFLATKLQTWSPDRTATHCRSYRLIVIIAAKTTTDGSNRTLRSDVDLSSSPAFSNSPLFHVTILVALGKWPNHRLSRETAGAWKHGGHEISASAGTFTRTLARKIESGNILDDRSPDWLSRLIAVAAGSTTFDLEMAAGFFLLYFPFFLDLHKHQSLGVRNSQFESYEGRSPLTCLFLACPIFCSAREQPRS